MPVRSPCGSLEHLPVLIVDSIQDTIAPAKPTLGSGVSLDEFRWFCYFLLTSARHLGCTFASPHSPTRLVTEFYELAINQQRPAEAARKYIDLSYRQHNPEVADGPDGFVQFISGMQKKRPKLTVVISKALADDDLVALHVHLKREVNDPGLAIVELFRLKNGKIIEHWDVVQPVPQTTASGNSMF